MSLLVPDPPSDLRKRANFASWSHPVPLFRCHDSTLEGPDFNPGFGSGGRFHWFDDERGDCVPVLYAANCYEGAIAETVFRNVPLSGRRTVYRKDYQGRTVTELRLDPLTTLELVQFHDPGLLRLGVRPNRLTATNSAHYPRTAKWARAVHQQLRNAQGLIWISGRFNTAQVLVLFEDRVNPTALQVVPGGVQPVDSGPGLERLVALAKSSGIKIARANASP